MSESEKPSGNQSTGDEVPIDSKPDAVEDPFQNKKKLDTSKVLDEIGRKNHVPRRSNKGGAKAATFFLFLLIFALAGATTWLAYLQWLTQDRYNAVVSDVRQENEQLLQQMTQVRASMESEQQALRTELAEQSGLLRDSNSALQEALAARDEAERNDEQRLDRLQQQISRDLDDVQGVVGALQRQLGNLQQRDIRWLNAEASYLMRLAQQKLQLETDLESTALLLRTIDGLLEDQSSALAQTARQNLADDLRALQETRVPDRAALARQLAALSDSLDQLSLAGSRQASYQERVTDQWQNTPQQESWLDAGMNLLRTIFVWRQWEDTPAEILPPQQETLFKQQLVMQLEQAQLAMLQGDQALYQQVLTQTLASLDRYFDQDNDRTRQLRADLEQLQAADVAVRLPDLSSTAELIRQLASNAGSAPAAQPAN